MAQTTSMARVAYGDGFHVYDFDIQCEDGLKALSIAHLVQFMLYCIVQQPLAFQHRPYRRLSCKK